MSDLIDKQSLIDAFESLDLIARQAATKSLVRPRVLDPYDQYWTGRNDQYNADVSALKDLPSAEPEIVRCKECKWSYDGVGGRICSYGVCVDCVVGDDFYCADAERRTDG